MNDMMATAAIWGEHAGSMAVVAATLAVTATAYYSWTTTTSCQSQRSMKIPVLSSWLPYVGNAPAYLASMNKFCLTHHAALGDTFVTTILGKGAFFFHPQVCQYQSSMLII